MPLNFFLKMALLKCHFSEIMVFGNMFIISGFIQVNQKSSLNHRSTLDKPKSCHTFSCFYKIIPLSTNSLAMTKKCHKIFFSTNFFENAILIGIPNRPLFIYFLKKRQKNGIKVRKMPFFLRAKQGLTSNTPIMLSLHTVWRDGEMEEIKFLLCLESPVSHISINTSERTGSRPCKRQTLQLCTFGTREAERLKCCAYL